jgi:hypothetical protein
MMKNHYSAARERPYWPGANWMESAPVLQSNLQNPPRQATPMSSLQHGVVLSHAAP